MKTTLVSMLLALPAFTGTATLEELEALAGQSAWLELLERAEDVPPAKRNDAWRGLVTKAATAVVQTDEARAQALSTRYGFLATHPGFSKVQGNASVTTLEKCLRRDDVKDALTDCVTTFRKGKPKADALVEAARLIRKQWNPAAPVELYADAAASAKETCSDAGLAESALAALELPHDATRAAVARTLTFETCWAALAPAMKKAMVHASTSLLGNACEPLRAKKALTEMQDELCRDEAAR